MVWGLIALRRKPRGDALALATLHQLRKQDLTGSRESGLMTFQFSVHQRLSAFPKRFSSRQDLFQDPCTSHTCQFVIAATVAVCQLFVVQTQSV